MADTTTELERIYTIPLRKTKDLVRSRRADLAVRDVKRFLTQHMKSETIWVDASVNESLWSKGKYNIPSRIRVRATRFSDGVVEVTLPEASSSGSIRTQLAERREKAAEKQILKAPEPEETDEEAAEHGEHAHPVADIKGVGAVTAEKLEKAGIATSADLAKADPAKVIEAIGGSVDKAKHLIDEAKAFQSGHSHDEPTEEKGEKAEKAAAKKE